MLLNYKKEVIVPKICIFDLSQRKHQFVDQQSVINKMFWTVK